MGVRVEPLAVRAGKKELTAEVAKVVASKKAFQPQSTGRKALPKGGNELSVVLGLAEGTCRAWSPAMLDHYLRAFKRMWADFRILSYESGVAPRLSRCRCCSGASSDAREDRY